MANKIRKVNVENSELHFVIRKSEFASGNNIEGIDVSGNGTLYATDFVNDIIYKIYEDGRVEGALVGVINTNGDVESSGVNNVDGGALGGQKARLSAPRGLCVDTSDNIYIADSVNAKIKRISPSGRCKTLAGTGVAGDVCSTNGAEAQFGNALTGICVDKSGIIYVADRANHKIKKIWPSGRTVSLAGSSAGAGFHNDQGAFARFSSPRDVAVDNAGNVYVADTGNNCIRKIDTAGNVTILAGGDSGAGTSGFVDGTALTSRFDSPARLAIDPSGQFLLVLDRNNNAVRRVTMNGIVTTFCSYEGPDAADGDIAIDNTGFVYISEKDV